MRDTESGPDSWKVKCGIRPADVVPMTDGGTLIMRSSPASSRASHHGATRHHHSPSIAPFAIDLEDLEEPARISDALGTSRSRTNTDYGRTTTPTSFWSGVAAGLASLGVGIAIGFIAFTTEPASHLVRTRHLVGHATSSLDVATVELAEAKAPPKKKAHRPARPAVVTGEEVKTEEATGGPVAPEPVENE